MFVGSRFQCQIAVNAQKIHGEMSKTQVVNVGQPISVEIPPQVIHVLV
jgi:hypothetical protein